MIRHPFALSLIPREPLSSLHNFWHSPTLESTCVCVCLVRTTGGYHYIFNYHTSGNDWKLYIILIVLNWDFLGLLSSDVLSNALWYFDYRFMKWHRSLSNFFLTVKLEFSGLSWLLIFGSFSAPRLPGFSQFKRPGVDNWTVTLWFANQSLFIDQ